MLWNDEALYILCDYFIIMVCIFVCKLRDCKTRLKFHDCLVDFHTEKENKTLFNDNVKFVFIKKTKRKCF